MKKFGLAAILTFVDKGASRGMERVGKRAEVLRRRFAGIGSGVSSIVGGLGQMATALLPVTGLFGLMIRDGMKFEQSMANLRAVTLDSSGKITESLRALAKTMGATTTFSASEAADAMTNLARAGLKADEIAKAIPGTLAAAAAEGIDLATAADLVASNIRAFKLPVEKAATVAGSLALVSARTNTNMVSLQEGMKLAAPTAKLAGYEFKETALALGSLADIGLKGTLSGTALRGALSQILSPTKKVLGAVGGRAGLNAILRKSNGEMKPLAEVMLGFAQRLRKIPDRAKRVDVAMKIFGKRAVAVMSAFDLQGKALDDFRGKQRELAKETGNTAEIMKSLMTRTLGGQLKLLRSALEATNNAIYEMVSEDLRGGIVRISDALGDFSLVLRAVRGEKFDLKTAMRVEEIKAAHRSWFELAKGIRDGFREAKAAIGSVVDSVRGLAGWFGISTGEGVRGTARVVTKYAALAAVLAPVGIATMGVTRLFGGLAKTALGAGKVVGNVLLLAARGAGGLLSVVGKRIPKVGTFLGKFGGLLGKAGKLTEEAKAQPVRVVNFHEFGVGGPRALPGQLPLPFGGAGAAGTAEVVGARARLSAFVGKFGIVGRLLNTNLLAAARGSGSLAMKLLGGAGTIAAVGAVGVAAWTLGRWLDEKLGISSKVADGLWKLFHASEEVERRSRVRAYTHGATVANVTKMATQLAQLSQRGVKTVTGEGGEKVALTREYARLRILKFLNQQNLTQQQINQTLAGLESTLRGIKVPGGSAKVAPTKPARDAAVTSGGLLPVSSGDVVLDRASLAQAVVSQLRGGLAGRVGAGALGGGDPGRTSPPPAVPTAPLRIEVPVTIDGRQIALAVAEVHLDELERSGATMQPGDRTLLLERGFTGGY